MSECVDAGLVYDLKGIIENYPNLMKFQSQSAAAEVNCFVFTPVNIIVSALVCLAGFGIAIIFGSEKIKARFSKRNASKKNTENN